MVTAVPASHSRSRRRRKWIVWAILLVVIPVGLFVGFREFWLTRLGRFLVQADPVCHADGAVILGGDENGSRILRGAELARQGYVSKVLVDGAPSSYEMTNDQLAINFAVRHGYGRELFIPFPMRANSTKEEAEIVVRRLQQLGWSRFMVVTSDFHTRRAARIFQHATANTNLTFCTVAAPTEGFTPDSWWMTREGRKILILEYAKTVAAWLGV